MRAWLGAAFVMLGIFEVRDARACGIAAPPGKFLRMAREQTLIVWDDQKRVEHFIRKPIFEGQSKDFGFFVPTPVTPEVAKVSPEIFDRLDDLFASPRTGKGAGDDAAPGRGLGGGVQVTQTVKIDGYELVSLKASDAGALGDWLKAHGYVDRPELREWSKNYVAKGFIINAMKLAGGEKRGALEPPTLRFSFKIEEPFYPYSEPPEDQEARQMAGADAHLQPRTLDVWVVGRRQTQALQAGKSSNLRVTNTMRVTRAALETALGDTKGWFDTSAEKTWVVSRLTDVSYARSRTDDLAFVGYDIPPPKPGFGVDGWEPPPPPRVTHPTLKEKEIAKPSPWRKRLALGGFALVLLLIVLYALREGTGETRA